MNLRQLYIVMIFVLCYSLGIAVAEDGTETTVYRTDQHVDQISTGFNPTYLIALSPDETQLATTAKDGYLQIFDLLTAEQVRGYLIRALSSPAYSPDGAFVYVVNSRGKVKRFDVSLSADDGEEIFSVGTPDHCFLSIDPGGRYLAAGTEEGVHLYDFQAESKRFIPMPRMAWRIAFDPIRAELVVGGGNGNRRGERRPNTFHNVFFYDLETGRLNRHFGDVWLGHCYDVSFNSDFSQLFVVSAHQAKTSLLVLDVDSLEIISELDTSEVSIPIASGHAGIFLNDQYVACGVKSSFTSLNAQGAICVFELKTGHLVAEFLKEPERPWDVVYSSELRRLAVLRGNSNLITLWDLPDDLIEPTGDTGTSVASNREQEE